MPRCKECREKFTPKYFLQKFCMKKDECISAFTEWHKDYQEKEKAKKWKKEKKVIKEKLETKTDVEKKLEKEVNTIVRLLDKGHNCISSNRPLGDKIGDYHAGHFYAVQGNPQIRFHLFNIFGQSIEQNKNKGGNPLGYMEGLENTFGIYLKDFCLSLKGLPSLNLEKHELEDKISVARGIVKWLKLQDRKFTNQERIELRKKFNIELGIYHDNI